MILFDTFYPYMCNSVAKLVDHRVGTVYIVCSCSRYLFVSLSFYLFQVWVLVESVCFVKYDCHDNQLRKATILQAEYGSKGLECLNIMFEIFQ